MAKQSTPLHHIRDGCDLKGWISAGVIVLRWEGEGVETYRQRIGHTDSARASPTFHKSGFGGGWNAGSGGQVTFKK